MTTPTPDIILEVNNVYKKFARSYTQARKQLMGTFWRAMWGDGNGQVKLQADEFWALKNVSFTLKRGETLGLIGLNGSGKSTLLKLINGIYLPDQGEIRLAGEVGGLIELNAGMQPALSGRDNIFIKGALLGRSRREMARLYEAIVDFAELDEFINSPVKTYSSGMKMRLGFAIAIHTKPDILLMDEVMAVGDFRFRQKCLDRVNELRQALSVIFVSHSMNQVSIFCDRVIVLHKGVIEYEGPTDEAIQYYMAEIENSQKKPATQPSAVKPFYGDLYHNEEKICQVEHYWADASLNKIEQATTGMEVNLVIRFQLKTTPKNLIIGVPIWDKNGNYITGISTDMDRVDPAWSQDGFYQVILNMNELIFNPNEYVSIIAINNGPEFYYRGLNDMLTVENYQRNFGFVTVSHKWWVEKVG